MKISQQSAVKGCGGVKGFKGDIHTTTNSFHTLDSRVEFFQIGGAAIFTLDLQELATLQITKFNETPEWEIKLQSIENLKKNDLATLMLKVTQSGEEVGVGIKEVRKNNDNRTPADLFSNAVKAGSRV